MRIDFPALVLVCVWGGCAMQPAVHTDARPSKFAVSNANCVIPEEVRDEHHAGYCDLPKDVRDFVARRDLCEHFLGEEPYDAERRRDLETSIEEHCSGTAKLYKSLHNRYQKDPATAAWLERYIIGFDIDADPSIGHD